MRDCSAVAPARRPEHLAERRDQLDRARFTVEREHDRRNRFDRDLERRAVVQATLRLTPKEDAKAYAKAVEGRVAALARAHTLLAAASWSGAALGSLVEGELAPFRPQAGASTPAPRVAIEGPEVLLSPGAARAGDERHQARCAFCAGRTCPCRLDAGPRGVPAAPLLDGERRPAASGRPATPRLRLSRAGDDGG